MKKKISLSLALTAMLIAMALTFSVTMVFSMNTFNNTVSSVKSKERMYNKLAEVDRYVRDAEFYDINDDTLNDTIASGYVLGINDKYARYYTAKQFAEKQSVESGKLMGIGVAVVRENSGSARIIRVYDNSPAQEMGLEKGGYITAVGDVSVRNMTDTAAVTSALLGEDGTTVHITYTGLNNQSTELDVTHSSYVISTVTSQVLRDTVGYVRVYGFSAGTGAEFRSAMDDLASQGVTSYVIDLRDNSGENLSSACAAADYCVPAGIIAKRADGKGKNIDIGVSDEKEVSAPIVCLVNGSTAQGAELFANALRKIGGASLVGTTTAGKGVVMSDPQSLSDGSAVTITVGVLMDGDEEGWNDFGLTPDVEVTLSASEQSSYYDFTVDTDPQIQQALQTAQTMVG